MNPHCKILAFCLIAVVVQALDSTTCNIFLCLTATESLKATDDVDYCKQLNAVNENIMVVTPGTYNITQVLRSDYSKPQGMHNSKHACNILKYSKSINTLRKRKL